LQGWLSANIGNFISNYFFKSRDVFFGAQDDDQFSLDSSNGVRLVVVW